MGRKQEKKKGKGRDVETSQEAKWRKKKQEIEQATVHGEERVKERQGKEWKKGMERVRERRKYCLFLSLFGLLSFNFLSLSVSLFLLLIAKYIFRFICFILFLYSFVFSFYLFLFVPFCMYICFPFSFYIFFNSFISFSPCSFSF